MSETTPKRILVADDDAMNREVMEAFLTMEHYSVHLAHNGSEALKLVEEELPDLLIVDVRMPDMSGIEVCQRVKTQPHTRHIPVLIVTGYSRVDAYEEAQNAQADDFLSRPFDGDDLIERVAALLRKTD